MKELVSVLLCTYKEPVGWVQQAFYSILNQTYENIEIIIVVDNPDNYEVISFFQHILDKFNNVKVIINKTNLGLVSSLNKGLCYCEGKYIARMDADDISLKDRIEQQVNYIKTHNFDLVGTIVQPFNDNGEMYPWHTCCTDYFIKKMLRIEGCIAHPSWLGKRCVFEDLHGYRKIEACEDYDFLVRAALAGYRLGNVPEVLLKYRINENGISKTKLDIQMKNSFSIGKAYSHNTIVSLDSMPEKPHTFLMFRILIKIWRKALIFADYLALRNRP